MKRLLSPVCAWESAGFLGSGRPSRRWAVAIAPLCLRNRFFPKSVYPAIGVLGVPNLVAVDLEELDARDGWILESRIDQQGDTEVGPLPVQPLMSHILSSAGSHSVLRSVEITQETSSSRGR